MEINKEMARMVTWKTEINKDIMVRMMARKLRIARGW